MLNRKKCQCGDGIALKLEKCNFCKLLFTPVFIPAVKIIKQEKRQPESKTKKRQGYHEEMYDTNKSIRARQNADK